MAVERPPPREPVGGRRPPQECVRNRGQAGGLSATKSEVQTLISEGRTLTQVMAARPTAAYDAQWGQEASWTANDFIPIVFYELGGGSLFVR